MRLIDSHGELPHLLLEMLKRTSRSLRGIRIASPYSTTKNVQREFRREVARRMVNGTLTVERVEVFYELDRLKEVLANVLKYENTVYRVRAYCLGPGGVAPGIGGYVFDEHEALLGGYWETVPPPDGTHSLLLAGDACRDFFRAYWGEIWRRGVWLNQNGGSDLRAVQNVALKLGLPAAEWPRFLAEAQSLDIGDRAPPLF